MSPISTSRITINMINPSACVPIPISSRDIDVQTGRTPGALRKRVVRGAVGLLLVVGATLLVELLRWGIGLLTAGGSTTDLEGGTTATTTITTIVTTIITTTASALTTPSLDEKVQQYMEGVLRRQSLG